jgi:hypothetical protein
MENIDVLYRQRFPDQDRTARDRNWSVLCERWSGPENRAKRGERSPERRGHRRLLDPVPKKSMTSKPTRFADGTAAGCV